MKARLYRMPSGVWVVDIPLPNRPGHPVPHMTGIAPTFDVGVRLLTTTLTRLRFQIVGSLLCRN